MARVKADIAGSEITRYGARYAVSLTAPRMVQKELIIVTKRMESLALAAFNGILTGNPVSPETLANAAAIRAAGGDPGTVTAPLSPVQTLMQSEAGRLLAVSDDPAAAIAFGALAVETLLPLLRSQGARRLARVAKAVAAGRLTF